MPKYYKESPSSQAFDSLKRQPNYSSMTVDQKTDWVNKEIAKIEEYRKKGYQQDLETYMKHFESNNMY